MLEKSINFFLKKGKQKNETQISTLQLHQLDHFIHSKPILTENKSIISISQGRMKTHSWFFTFSLFFFQKEGFSSKYYWKE